MKFKKENRIRLGFLACFMLLSAAFLVSILNTNRLLKQIRLANHNTYILKSLDRVAADINDIRSTFRGTLLTSDSMLYLQYNTLQAKTATALQQLTVTLFYNKLYRSNLLEVNHLLQQEQQLTAATLAQRKNNVLADSTLVRLTAEETALTNRMLETVKQIEAIENKELDKKMNDLMHYNNLVTKINFASLVLVITIISYSLYIYNQENRAKREADNKTHRYQDQLKKRILDLKNANEELRLLRGNEKFSATGRVARTIAHEIRNPLTNINLACAHLFGNKDLLPYKSMVEVIRNNSDRINHLITDLLNSTRFIELKFSRTSINYLLDETLKAAEDSIQLKKIEVVKDYLDGICDIMTDVEKMKIAFFNIIINAIDAMEEGKGILVIKTETRLNKCVTTITDNGSGIEEDMLNKLFEPYVTNKQGGTGLGLTNTQNIILNHHGHITVESSPGVGTCFVIQLDHVSDSVQEQPHPA